MDSEEDNQTSLPRWGWAKILIVILAIISFVGIALIATKIFILP